jgi:uracil-DNA glycosylase family 4
MTFEELITQCKKCTRCRLREKATQVVPGDGSPKADIMFIGEGPGANEDKEGIPFCGAAGKFLDQLLESIGIKRSEVYITNMVKCRPPGNRDPSEDEIKACRPWLDKQIEFIDPKIFVLLGRFAMAKFFPNLKISKVHGQIFKKGGKTYFIMYHPAVALYNENFKKVMMDDMEELKRFLDGDESEVEVLDPGVSEIRKLMKKTLRQAQGKKQQLGMGL